MIVAAMPILRPQREAPDTAPAGVWSGGEWVSDMRLPSIRETVFPEEVLA